MKLFSPLSKENFRTFILFSFVLSSLIPILIAILITINYVFPSLSHEQIEKLSTVFAYGLLIMFLFPSLSFFLLFHWMTSLEKLTKEIKSKSVEIIEDIKNIEGETEIDTIRHVVDGLHNELQEKMNKLSQYSKKLIDSNIELSVRSVTDSLTGLYNRRYFESRLSEEIDRSERFDHKLSIIMFDVDDLKQYNDILGHECGDELLRKIGDIVKRTIRNTDIAFRYGGDEFTVLLTECDLEGAEIVAHKLVRAVSNCHFFADSGKVPFKGATISCGVTSYRKGMKNFVGEVDKLLLNAKNDGKGFVRSSSRK